MEGSLNSSSIYSCAYDINIFKRSLTIELGVFGVLSLCVFFYRVYFRNKYNTPLKKTQQLLGHFCGTEQMKIVLENPSHAYYFYFIQLLLFTFYNMIFAIYEKCVHNVRMLLCIGWATAPWWCY